MSYCRFSSDNFNCDIYACESREGNFVIHVADYRMRRWLRVFYWLTDKRHRVPPGYQKMSFRVSRAWASWLIDKLPHWLTHTRIGLNHDGASFQYEDEVGMLGAMMALKIDGYRMPYTEEEIEALIEEALENEEKEQAKMN